MVRPLLLTTLLLSFGLRSYGQNCLDLYQLERMLLSSVSYEEVDSFLRENSYYTRSSGSSTLILETDSISTVYYKNSYYGSSAAIYNRVGTTSRIVVYDNSDCSYEIQRKLLDERYELVKNDEIKTYRKGSTTLMVYPDGTVVLYGKSISDFRTANQKQRVKRQEILARLEAQFVRTIETYRAKLLNYRVNSDTANYARLYSQFNGAVSEAYKTREEFASVADDILNSWKVKLTKEVNLQIANNQFAQALDVVSKSAFPDPESTEELIELIIDNRLRHELALLVQALQDAVTEKNYTKQIDLAAQIVEHPKVSIGQKTSAERTSSKAKETLQLIAKRKSSTITYWQHYPEKKAQVERILHEYLLTKVERKKRGEFVFAMRVSYDTSGVRTTRYTLESEDEELKSAINSLLTPVAISNLYFKATDTLYFNSSWSTDRHVAIRTFKGTEYSNFSTWNSDISNLISNSTSQYGTFKFDVHQLTVNGSPYSSIEFVKHRVGKSVLSNLVKSLVVPGLGRRAANYGKPNKKFQEILLIGGTAVGAELYSQGIMATYNQNPTRSDLFDEAQLWHRISLGAAAIGAVDYLNEQFYVLIKSFRNLTDSRKTNQELKIWSKSNFANFEGGQGFNVAIVQSNSAQKILVFESDIEEIETNEEVYSFTNVENRPVFPGCENLLTEDERFNCFNLKARQFVGKNFEFPEMAKQMGIQGKVWVSFVIDKDGEVTNVKVDRGVDKLLDEESLRVVSALPKMSPAKIGGRPVKMSYTLPINARLQ
jgi:TonB family protein